MTYNSEIHHRRSIRLRGYDYSQNGAYFLTICTHNRECLFGEISTDTVGARSVTRPDSTVTRPDSTVTRPDYNPAHQSKPSHQPEPARMMLNDAGNMVNFTWDDLPNHNSKIVLDSFVIMPNHIHGIVVIADDEVGHESRAGLEKRAGLEPAPTVSEIVRQFKTFTARRINQIRQAPGMPVWQRNYYERIIRNDEELNRIRQYIIDNPMNWKQDENNIFNP